MECLIVVPQITKVLCYYIRLHKSPTVTVQRCTNREQCALPFLVTIIIGSVNRHAIECAVGVVYLMLYALCFIYLHGSCFQELASMYTAKK